MFCVWGTAVLASVVVLWAYDKRPGSDISRTCSAWPANELIECDSDRPTAILFAHPKCPCTRSSLRQFADLVRGADASVLVVFYLPRNGDETWRQTENIELVASIPEAKLVWDIDGATALQFDATVSGQCFVFGPQESCLFAGGITVSRGHDGDNQGAAAFAACLTSTPNTTQVYPCYGCALFDR